MTTISRHNKVNQDKSVHCTSQTIEIVRVYYRLSPIKFIGLIFLTDFMTLMKVYWGHLILFKTKAVMLKITGAMTRIHDSKESSHLSDSNTCSGREQGSRSLWVSKQRHLQNGTRISVTPSALEQGVRKAPHPHSMGQRVERHYRHKMTSGDLNLARTVDTPRQLRGYSIP